MSFPYNTDGITDGFTAPAGIYTLQILSAVEKKTKEKGYPMVSVKCEIADKGDWFGTSFYHNVTFLPKDNKGAGMSIKFLKAIGEPFEGTVIVNPENWVNKTFKAKVVEEFSPSGLKRNAVAYLLDSNQADEVPF